MSLSMQMHATLMVAGRHTCACTTARSQEPGKQCAGTALLTEGRMHRWAACMHIGFAAAAAALMHDDLDAIAIYNCQQVCTCSSAIDQLRTF
jgi:hypothetical protein